MEIKVYSSPVSENSNKIAVIGGGISGLSIARLLSNKGYKVRVYEKESTPGGLVRCSTENGILYHRVGGHVFNSRKKEVLDWFWQQFRKEDFTLAQRHSVVVLPKGMLVDYPIENHLYQMPEDLRNAVLGDLLEIAVTGYPDDANFDDFLLHRFGRTLYECYFAPYNSKIWRRSLQDVPLSWLRGKLPMPSVKEILAANIGQVKELNMVHSTFYYPKKGGSQFIANTLAEGLNVRYDTPVTAINKVGNKWIINHEDEADIVIFCGNALELPAMLRDELGLDFSLVHTLEHHGTTSVLCEVEQNPYSWIYMPDRAHESHRIICTGNFAKSNSPEGKYTATIEFSKPMSREEIERQLALIPFSPKYITHHYAKYTYPVQNGETRGIINGLKAQLEPRSFYLLGRFAEWEYYNMDAAMDAAMQLCNRLK